MQKTGAYVGYQIATDLTAWRNGDAKLTSVKVLDDLIEMPSVGNNKPTHQKLPGIVSGYHGIVKTIAPKFEIGSYKASHYGQSAKMIYWALGACTTTPNTPSSGYHSKSITPRTTNVPINLGLHVERESSSNNLRYDLLGLLVPEYHWKCEDGGVVQQDIDVEVAYVKSSSTDDIARPTVDSHPPFEWGDLIAGGLTLTYNSADVAVDITSIDCFFKNTTKFAVWDGSKYASKGYYRKYEYGVKLRVKPQVASLLYGINKLAFADYAGALSLTAKWQKHATQDYLQWVFTNLVLEPFDEKIGSDNEPEEEYEITLSNTQTSTLTVTSIDTKDKSYFEVA